jgi:hypothetical protein
LLLDPSTGYHAVAFDAHRAPPAFPPELSIYVYADGAGGSLSIADTRLDPQPTSFQTTYLEPGDDLSHARLTVIAAEEQFQVTASNVADASVILKSIGDSLATPGADIQSIVATTLPAYKLTASAIGRSPVETGYAVEYASGNSHIELSVFPIAGGTSVQAADAASSQAFLNVIGGTDYVVRGAVTGDTPQTSWVAGSFLVSLMAPPDVSKSLVSEVKPTTEPLSVAIPDEISKSLAESQLVARSTVGTWQIERRTGNSGSQGAACIRISEAAVKCSEFSLVGSVASIAVGSSWYIVAIVPSSPPTTYFRTVPALKFESSTSGDWSFSIAQADAGIDNVTAYASTDGVAPAELQTVFKRPTPG